VVEDTGPLVVGFFRGLLPVWRLSTFFSLSSELDVKLCNTGEKSSDVLVGSAKLLLVLPVLGFEVDQLPVGLQLDTFVSGN